MLSILCARRWGAPSISSGSRALRNSILFCVLAFFGSMLSIPCISSWGAPSTSSVSGAKRNFFSWVVSHMNESYRRVMSHMSMCSVTRIGESCHMKESCCTYGGVTHMDESCYTCHMYVIHVDTSCHTYGRVMSHIWTNHTYGRVMIHTLNISTSHVARMDESCYTCHTYRRVMSHIWISHVTHMNKSCHTYGSVTHMNKSCHTYEFMCDMNHSYMTLSYVWHDSSIRVTWRVDMSCRYIWHV